MTTLLKDDVVLITGGGSGLGAGVARHCLAEGAKLAIMDISGAKLDSLRTELGDEPLLFQGDATKLADLQACREAILGRFGRLNAFIGAQGIWDGNVPLRDIPIEKLDEAFDEVFHINVKSYILSARVFLDLLEKEQGAAEQERLPLCVVEGRGCPLSGRLPMAACLDCGLVIW